MTPEQTLRAWLPMTEGEIVEEWTTLRRLHPTQFKGDALELLKSLESKQLAFNDRGTWRVTTPELEKQSRQRTLFI
jgi:hypothetical protein